jgi:hypothetical protein
MAFGRWSAYADREKILLRRRRPTLGAERLRRPISIGAKAFGRWSACADRESVLCVGGGRRLARSALRGRFQSASKAFGRGSACADREKILLRRRRPTLGAERLGRPISIGAKAFGRWSACADREKILLRRRRPTLGAPAPGEADFNRRQRPSAGGRPTPTWKSTFCVGGGRRLARSALRGRFQSASKAFGRRSACADRESVFASAEADAWRAAPEEADFNRRQGLRPVSRLRRPGKRSLRRRRPTPGAQRLKRPISIGFQGRRLARSAFEGRFQSAPGWRSGLPLLPAPVIESRCPETADGR